MKKQLSDEERGALIGVRQICHYMGIGTQTFYRLCREHRLPVTTLPDGRYCTAKSLTDGWIEARWKAQTSAAVGSSNGEAA